MQPRNITVVGLGNSELEEILATAAKTQNRVLTAEAATKAGPAMMIWPGMTTTICCVAGRGAMCCRAGAATTILPETQRPTR